MEVERHKPSRACHMDQEEVKLQTFWSGLFDAMQDG